jgi:hypothetical protein
MPGNLSGYSDITYYRIGDPLLERDRAIDWVPMQLLAGSGNFFSLFKPDEGDFKGVKKALEFLKFTPDEVTALRNVIGTAVNIGTSVASVVGAVGTVVDLAKKLGIFGDQEKSVESYLKDIMKRVDQIYAFLENEATRGLEAQASSWRATVDNTRVIVANVRISRDDNVLDRAEDATDRLTEAIRLMLDPTKAKISFRRSTYGSQSPHWSDLAVSPLMTKADGGKIALNSGGVAEIWDAGHYYDVLVYALRERLLMAYLLEPAFPSTAYDRSNLNEIGDNIKTFVAAWRTSILVMNPNAQLSDGGLVYNPLHPYPSDPPESKRSILVGAVDPVTGISSIDTFGDFETRVWLNPTPVGTHSSVWASDVQAARQAASFEQAKRVDQVVQACGILDLERLARAFHDAAQLPTRSQFVRLSSPKVVPSPVFGPIDIDTPFGVVSRPIVLEGRPEEVTLGDLAAFSGDPSKTYSAQRFFRGTAKSTQFRVALRADRTKTQLGYRVVVCGKEVPIVPFSFRATPGNDFPLEPIELAHSFDTTVWDICQSKHLTFTEENRLESEPDAFVLVENNRRPGRANVQLRITYTHPPADSISGYVGHVNVKISALEPEEFPDAFDAKVEVFETIVGENENATEYLADTITTAIVPSYLLVEKEFFEDRWKAFEAMLRSVKELVVESADFPALVPPVPEEPDWQRRFDVTVQTSIAWLQSAEEIEPLLVKSKIDQLQIPVIRG